MSISPERQKLESSINELYEVFANYPLPGWINCNSHQTQSRLNCLKQVTHHNFIWSWEQPSSEFKSLLPRVFELIAFDDLYEHHSELIQDLYFAHWQRWERTEHACIHNYLIHLWKYLLSDYPSPLKYAPEIAYEIGYVYTDVTIFLKILEERCETLEGIQHLGDIVGGAFGAKLTQQPWVLPLLEKTYYELIDTPIGDLMARAVKEIEQNG